MAAKRLTDNNGKSLSIAGLSSVTVNNTIYIYGDKKTHGYNNIWLVSAKDVSNNISPTPLTSYRSSNAVPNLRYSPGVTLDNSVIVFSSNSNTSNANDYMSIYSFDLTSSHNYWTLISPSNSSTPLSKQEYSISKSPQKEHVYLFGGNEIQKTTNTTAFTNAQNDFWVYHTKSNKWNILVSPYTSNITRCGHTANMLSDGRLIIIGGYYCATVQKTSSVSNLDLIQMDQLLIFDTNTSIWIDPPQVKGAVPPPRTFHSAIVINNNGDIFICGGQNEIVSPFQVYLGSQVDHLGDMTGILDTNLWTWRSPKQSYSNLPYPQSSAVISILNETKLAYGFGINYHTVYDNFHVFNILTESWEDSAPSSTIFGGILVSNDYGFSPRIDKNIMWAIVGCICFAIICSYVVAVWNFGVTRIHMKFLNTLKLIKREVWKPRIGEPGWAETSRLVLKLLFLFLFVYLISTLTSQVINSPIIDQLSYEDNSDMTVDVPDIKFCFDDWIEKERPYVRCTTDFGIQCSDFILPLPVDGVDKMCMLFRAPSSFKIGETSERLLSNGSFLIFDYYYNGNLSTSDISQIQIDVYNKFHNPNVPIYNQSSTFDNNTTVRQFEWNDKYEQDLYQYADSKGLSIKNSHQVNFGVVNTITFELIKRVSLNPGIWNYAGVASSVKTKYEIETMSTPESFITVHDPSSGAPQPLGTIHVVPLSCQTRVLREQKAFAFINAMGIFGGLFGLLFSLQSCLFGYRPRSPWGYMHRWSFGHLRSSLMRGLQANFFPNAFTKDHMILPMVDKYANTTPENSTAFTTPISKNTNGIQPLAINTKNLNTSYLLPASPVISFPVNNSEKDVRMAQIEDRIHMLERLFQAYYIDDEIFRSLDNALKNEPSSSSGDSVMEGGGRKRK